MPKPFGSVSKIALADIKLVISDFDGVFTDNSVLVDENGVEHVKCSRLDGIGIAKLKAIGIDLVVVSSEPNNVVQRRCEKLGVEAYNNVKNKGEFIMELLKERDLEINNALFIGNDENDISALDSVQIGVGVSDSYGEFHDSVEYVLRCNGGAGAIRELCEIIVKNFVD